MLINISCRPFVSAWRTSQGITLSVSIELGFSTPYLLTDPVKVAPRWLLKQVLERVEEQARKEEAMAVVYQASEWVRFRREVSDQ